MFTAFIILIIVLKILFVCSMERYPHGRPTPNKSDILMKRMKMEADLGYLYPIAEDGNRALDEEMWEAISQFKRFQMDKTRTKKWQCKKVKKIHVDICNEWEKRWSNLMTYLAYYREFGRYKIGAKIGKALAREKQQAKTVAENTQWLQQKMAQQLDATGMLDHLAIKPHFKAYADGSRLTFVEALCQCFFAYNALFGWRENKFGQIYKCFCGIDKPTNGGAQIVRPPPFAFVNETECRFVNEWVLAYKRAKTLEDSEPRRTAQLLLSSIVPMIENGEQIHAETLKRNPFQLFPALFVNQKGEKLLWF